MAAPLFAGLEAGRLRCRVALIAFASPEDRNELGEPIEQPFVEDFLWADVRTLRGQELVYAQQVQAVADSVVEVRWRPGLEETGRQKAVGFQGRQLNIDAAVDPEGLRVRLLLFCREER